MPRENLRTIDLPAFHQPLAARPRPVDDDDEGDDDQPLNPPPGDPTPGVPANAEARKPVARSSDSKVVEMYPSLAAPPRERLIPMSARIPLSMLEELEQVCKGSNIDVSALVRDFIAAGLRSLKAGK